MQTISAPRNLAKYYLATINGTFAEILIKLLSSLTLDFQKCVFWNKSWPGKLSYWNWHHSLINEFCIWILITLLTKICIVKAMVFPVVMHRCESWIIKKLKNCCFLTVELKKILDSPLDGNKIKPVNPKGNQLWIFIGRTDAEAVAPILWPPDVKSWLIGKKRDAGKDWGQEKGVAEDEMVRWHHGLNGHEFEQTLGDREVQGGLTFCSLWGHKSWTELSHWATVDSWRRVSLNFAQLLAVANLV